MSDFQLAESLAQGWFEITSMVTPELYDTKCYYELIVAIIKCKKLSKIIDGWKKGV